MESKIIKNFIYDGFGFPVSLKNVKVYKVGDAWAPRIDLEKISKRVIQDLSKEKDSFTGDEIYFIRSFLKMTKVEFGKKLSVSHVAVSNWERKRAMEVPFLKENFDSLVVLLKGLQPKKKKKVVKKKTAAELIANILKNKANPALELSKARAILAKNGNLNLSKSTKKKATKRIAPPKHYKSMHS